MKEIKDPDGHTRFIATTAEELGRCIAISHKSRRCKLWYPPKQCAILKKQKQEDGKIKKSLLESGLTRG